MSDPCASIILIRDGHTIGVCSRLDVYSEGAIEAGLIMSIEALSIGQEYHLEGEDVRLTSVDERIVCDGVFITRGSLFTVMRKEVPVDIIRGKG